MNNQILAAICQRFFYQDSFCVSRAQPQVQANGSTRHIATAVEGLQDLPCAFSSNSHASSYPNKMMHEGYRHNSFLILKRIFCHSSYDLRAGDLITVTSHTGYRRRFLAGEPMKYGDHQEILLQDEVEA
jgi:hypothetical protein